MSEREIFVPLTTEPADTFIPDQVHFVWPPFGSVPLVNPTEADKLAEQERLKAGLAQAITDFSVTHAGSFKTIWRREPEWCEERRYETGEVIGWIAARATICCEPYFIPSSSSGQS